MGARKVEEYLTRRFEERVARNSIEREQKYRVANVAAIRKRLLKLGAHVHASGFERNELFDCDDRLRRQSLSFVFAAMAAKWRCSPSKGCDAPSDKKRGWKWSKIDCASSGEFPTAVKPRRPRLPRPGHHMKDNPGLPTCPKCKPCRTTRSKRSSGVNKVTKLNAM